MSLSSRYLILKQYLCISSNWFESHHRADMYYLKIMRKLSWFMRKQLGVEYLKDIWITSAALSFYTQTMEDFYHLFYFGRHFVAQSWVLESSTACPSLPVTLSLWLITMAPTHERTQPTFVFSFCEATYLLEVCWIFPGEALSTCDITETQKQPNRSFYCSAESESHHLCLLLSPLEYPQVSPDILWSLVLMLAWKVRKIAGHLSGFSKIWNKNNLE